MDARTVSHTRFLHGKAWFCCFPLNVEQAFWRALSLFSNLTPKQPWVEGEWDGAEFLPSPWGTWLASDLH